MKFREYVLEKTDKPSTEFKVGDHIIFMNMEKLDLKELNGKGGTIKKDIEEESDDPDMFLIKFDSKISTGDTEGNFDSTYFKKG